MGNASVQPEKGSCQPHGEGGSPAIQTRENKNRHPFRDYVVVDVLGVGSAGEVCKVRRRAASAAESARRRRRRVATSQGAFQSVTDALLGGMFQTCTKSSSSSLRRMSMITTENLSSAKLSSYESTLTSPTAELSSQWSSSFRWRDVDRSSSLSGELSLARQAGAKDEVFYALKSTTHFKGGSSKSLAANEYFTRELLNEISTLRKLDHPYIIKPVETFAHRNHLFLATEICTGGDLHSREPYTEVEATAIVTSILSALAYMHGKNVAHRDIKFENILFASNSPTSPVKLIDFGLSKDFSKQDFMNTGVGTIIMMAPQVFQGKYTAKADVWSVGVLTYMLLSGCVPFFGKTRRHVIKKIMKGVQGFKGGHWDFISREAKSFVSTLLQVDEAERPSAYDGLKHPWTKKFRDSGISISDVELHCMAKIGVSMESFSRFALIKKLALLIIAQRSTSEEIGYLGDIFQCFDTDATGLLTEANVKACLSRLGYSSKNVHRIFQGLDFLGYGHVGFSVFLAATLETNGPIPEVWLTEAFDIIDFDRDGAISSTDLRATVQRCTPQCDVDIFMKNAM
eukprot:CAMPEP_0197443912 /NCGR_PEP_ID=MMETSP1175-20131217/9535_1 /TAXON_ID=1003142 /ORGANISM="Triceratium dubium, Strain CCMP147" /LENGTH=569 /DNA_ID=CAMNT_0042974619 /DNA_START=137 /DNA_END=1843 /DNA_ORIENTATION=+